MEIIFSSNALKELDHWKKAGEAPILKEIRQLLESIQATPYEGIGKPEALKNNFRAFGQGQLPRNTGWCIALKPIKSLYCRCDFITSKF